MSYAALAAPLQERLGLAFPPVALKLVHEPPAGIARTSAPVPSACTFWRRAEQGVFYAAADEHLNCPIGAMVMGFELSAAKMQELMGLVQQMCAIAYVKPEEVAHIPKFTTAPKGIVYGPLASFPLDPDVALLWATPRQAMVLQEAAGAVQWTEHPAGALFGRPACGALPTASARGKPTVSVGCMGMRTYTEIPDDYCLVAIPGASLASLAEALETTHAAHERMRQFYLAQKARF
jgi:uncharacterized protein (DUF169 family)